MHVATSFRSLAVGSLVCLMSAACGSAGVATQSARPMTPVPTVAPTPTVPMTPSPTTPEALDIDTLPVVSPDPSTLTVVCDPEAAQEDVDFGEATIYCIDSVRLVVRALATVTTAPIERLYFQRPTCAAAPCTDDELSTATVTGWTSDGSLTVALDSRLTTVGIPTTDPSIVWPEAGSSVVPAVSRPDLEGAPAEVVDRTPFPYCGEAEVGLPEEIEACFRDAVLSGRSAEMIDRVYGTEGGAITWLYRFDGHGAIVRYSQEGGAWQRQAGSMILGILPMTWSFDPWSETTTQS